MTPDGSEGHLAAFFDAQRDFWWNEDFLRLVVERLGLGPTRSVLDVGCGLGHWSRELTHVLPAVAEVRGIDPEMAWVSEARRQCNWRSDEVTEVEVRFEAVAEGTRVRLRHHGFDSITSDVGCEVGYETGRHELLGWYSQSIPLEERRCT